MDESAVNIYTISEPGAPALDLLANSSSTNISGHIDTMTAKSCGFGRCLRQKLS
jgi:hypothetical protein